MFCRRPQAHLEVRGLGKAVGGNAAESHARRESRHPIYDVREHQAENRRVVRRCSAAGMGFLRHWRDSENDSDDVNVSSAARANETQGTDVLLFV